MKPKNGFTLIEILIVVAVIAILAIIAIMLINPTKQRQKLYDSQRKRDLNHLKGLYEDYYSQNQTYPRGEDICYDTPVDDAGVCSCHICGLVRNTGNIFGQLVHVMYCDPEEPKMSYLYEYDCVNAYPQWYKMYAQLSNTTSCSFGVTNQPNSSLSPYPNSCNSTGGGGGGPTSTPVPPSPTPGGGGPSNTPTPAPTLPSCPADPIPKYCLLGPVCNICGDFANCNQPSSCNQPPQLYSNSICTLSCQ